MKLTYTTANGRLTFEVDVATGKSAFDVVAHIQELFEVEKCGRCQSGNIRCEVREFDANKYYKMICNDCNAQLDFGQNKDGKGLFVKRWDKETKQPLADGGWYIWTGR